MFEYVSVYTNISEKDTRDGRHGVRIKKNEVAAKFFFVGTINKSRAHFKNLGLHLILSSILWIELRIDSSID